MSEEGESYKGNRFDHLYDQIMEYLDQDTMLRAFGVLAAIDFAERTDVKEPVKLAAEIEQFILHGATIRTAEVKRIK